MEYPMVVVEETVGRLLRIFPLTECLSADFQPGNYNTRSSYRLGDLDVTYDHERLSGGAKIVRIAVWRNCDALLAIDVLEHGAVDSVHQWQDAKIREQLLPIIVQKLILDDLADVRRVEEA